MYSRLYVRRLKKNELYRLNASATEQPNGWYLMTCDDTWIVPQCSTCYTLEYTAGLAVCNLHCSSTWDTSGPLRMLTNQLIFVHLSIHWLIAQMGHQRQEPHSQSYLRLERYQHATRYPILLGPVDTNTQYQYRYTAKH